MPEEHTGQLGFEYAWKELLARTRQAGTQRSIPETSFGGAAHVMCYVCR